MLNLIRNITESELVAEARHFAAIAHDGQYRKGSVFSSQENKEPYFNHPKRVAAAVYEMVPWHPDIETIVAAAYLHDTVEDCDVDLDGIEVKFGKAVAVLVRSLTDVYTKEAFPHRNREWRKLREALRLRWIADEAKLIKMADISDNSDMLMARPDFAAMYFREKARVIEEMQISKVVNRMNEMKTRLTQ